MKRKHRRIHAVRGGHFRAVKHSHLLAHTMQNMQRLSEGSFERLGQPTPGRSADYRKMARADSGLLARQLCACLKKDVRGAGGMDFATKG